MPLLKNLWSQTRVPAEGGTRCLQLRIQIPVSEKNPSQLLPEADCITAFRESKVVETLKQSASSEGNFFQEKILMGKFEGSAACVWKGIQMRH